MSISAIYRLCIWLPILLPAVLIAVLNVFDIPVAKGLVSEVLAWSLIVGGLPYAALAAWATWWVGGQPESAIRRLMFRAPLLMLAVFVPLALAMGLFVGAPGPYAAVAAFGAVVIVLLGYAYVALTMLIRMGLGPGEPRA